MKSIFELFGFLSMACITAAIIFILMGKKDLISSAGLTEKPSLYEAVADAPDAPKSVTKGTRDSYASDSGSARGAKSARTNSASDRAVAPEERLKALYRDDEFVYAAVKEWRASVTDMAEAYNVKPQVLLAHAVVQAYLGEYSKGQLRQDAAQHGGDQVMSASAAAKRYPYAWSVQKMMEQHRLDQYFTPAVAMADAGSSGRMVSAKNATGKYTEATKSPKVTPNTQNAPMEAGIRAMVAKEYGFSTWAGLERLADADMKQEAQRRVRSLMMAARVK